MAKVIEPYPDADDAARLAVLETYPTEAQGINYKLDRLAELAAQICEVPVGLVSIVGEESQRFIGRFGTDLRETPRSQSFCSHAMLTDKGMTVPDATADARFADNPLVTGDPSIRFYAGKPLNSPEGQPLGALCVIDDTAREAGLTPEQERALETLSMAVMTIIDGAREERRSAVREGRTRFSIGTREDRFRILADAMPQLVWSSTAKGYTDYFNKVWCDFTGVPAHVSHGMGWLDLVHPSDIARVGESWKAALEDRSAYEIEYRLRRHDGEYRWVLARGVPMRDDNGDIIRWFGTCTDIDDRKVAAQRLEILSRELSHRIKNIFAVIGGLISMSIRRSPALAGEVADLQERILALGRAHEYVRTHEDGTVVTRPTSSLHGMLSSLLEAYANDSDRIAFSGADPDIDDRAATPLALFFHELATNAVKYGALSVVEGTVSINVIETDEGISICWQERGGPVVYPAAESGFGATLIEMSIVRQLGGKLEYDWHPDGLEVTALIPRQTLNR